MAYADLRDFIARLEAEGELIRITAPVSPHLEITEITDRLSKSPADHNKALLFENVEGYTMPVLINALGSARRMAYNESGKERKCWKRHCRDWNRGSWHPWSAGWNRAGCKRG